MLKVYYHAGMQSISESVTVFTSCSATGEVCEAGDFFPLIWHLFWFWYWSNMILLLVALDNSEEDDDNTDLLSESTNRQTRGSIDSQF